MKFFAKSLWILKAELRLAARGQAIAFGAFSRVLSPITFLSIYVILCVGAFMWFSAPIQLFQNQLVHAIITLIAIGFLITSLIPATREVILAAPSLTLILTSPFSMRAYLMARIYALALRSSLFPLLIITPFFNAAILHGYLGGFLIYPFILSLAIITSSFCVSLLVVFHSFLRSSFVISGARVVGLVCTILFFLAFNFGKIDPSSLFGLYQGKLGACLRWIGAGVSGKPVPTFFLLTIAIVSPLVAAKFSATPFRSLSRPLGQKYESRTSGKATSFSASFFLIVFKKELRLVLRNPGVFVQFLRIFVAIAIALTFFSRNGLRVSFLGPALMLVCTLLANDMSWLIARVEKAGDLLNMSPTNARKLKIYKALIASIFPAIATIIGTFAIFQLDKIYSAKVAVTCVAAIILSVLANVHLSKRSSLLAGLSESDRQPIPVIFAQGLIILAASLFFYFSEKMFI
ncbi:hypothetical protein [Massilia putida]|uniref:hypothetical protein n=1 Tax=Massilia putida TaxID=1141883 RepID=UPI0012EC1D75|nr:hypothetical protein [Massilia putida]